MDDPQALLQRRRIWGVPPDAVAMWVAACQREQEELSAQIATLELRITRIAAERDAVSATVAALKEDIARLEAEKAEWKGRPEAIRAEAIQFVVDAYAEAQQARTQIAQEIAAEKAAAREAMKAERAAAQEEIAAIRRDLDAERRRHEAAVAALQQQRAETIASLDAIGRSLLAQLGRSDTAAPDTTPPSREHVREMSTDPMSAITPETPHTDPLPVASDSYPRPDLEGPNLKEPAPNDSSAGAVHATAPEDTMLARALDELEAILRGNRKAGSEN